MRRVAGPPWGPIAAVAAVTAAIYAILYARLSAHPMEPYGDSAAQYIEHMARLRLVERVASGVSANPVEALVQLDALYPPGLHIAGAVGNLFLGWDVSGSAWIGPAALTALAMSMGAIAWKLRPGAGGATAIATLLLPGLHAAATRYYYDLPMTAALWASIALLAVGLGRAPWFVLGPGVGALLATATLIKWTALPFGVPMLIGAALTFRSERGLLPTLLGAVMTWALLSGGLVLAGSSSFGSMGSATFQPPPGADVLPSYVEAALGPLPGAIHAISRAMLLQLSNMTLQRMAFYPVRLVLTVLAPIGVIAMALPLAAWAHGAARGFSIVLWAVLAQGLFLLLLVPPLDDRFLLTMAPALALAAGLGWRQLGDSARLPLGAFLIGGGLALAADFHLRDSDVRIERRGGALSDPTVDGTRWQPRLGLSTSWDQRGWTRSDQRRPDRAALRDQLWTALEACDAANIAGPEYLITAWGDGNWWSWRDLLARADAGFGAHPRVERRYWAWRADGPIAPEPPEPDVLLTAEPPDAFGSPQLIPNEGWRTVTIVPSTDGGPSVRIWDRLARPSCPLAPPPESE